MDDITITPEPSDEEAAAIAAAVSVVTTPGAEEPTEQPVPRWRFSGRWWSAPVNSRRARP